MIAASSADDVVAISGFGIFVGLTFFKDALMVQLMMHGPLKVLLVVSFGTLWGLMAQWIPTSSKGMLLSSDGLFSSLVGCLPCLELTG